MNLTIRFLGTEVLALDFTREKPAEPTAITGGASHNFEREQTYGFIEERT